MNFADIFDKYPALITKSIDDTFASVSNTGTEFYPGYPDPGVAKFVTLGKAIAPDIAFMRMGSMRPLFAAIVGYSGEYPIVKAKGTLSEENVQEIKLAIATEFTEIDYKLLRKMSLYLAANQNAFYQELLDRILITPAKLTEALVILATKLLIDLFYGQCQYIDTLTGLGWEMSYLNDIPIENRPLDLAGVNLWSAPATAKPLENISAHLRAYFKNARSMPAAIAMPSAVAEFLLNADDTKTKIIRSRGFYGEITPDVFSSVARPTLEDVITWLRGDIVAFSSVNVPSIVISDAVFSPYQVNNIASNLSTLDIPFLRSDSYVFLSQGIVEGYFTPTATNDFQSPLAFFVKNENAPRKDSPSVDTSFIGYCTSPRQLGWRKVI